MSDQPNHPHEDWYPENYEQVRLLKIYPDISGQFMWQGSVCINLGDWFIGHEELEVRFSAWADEFPYEYDDIIEVAPSDPKWQDWKRRGFELAKEVRAIVPDEYTIFYYPFGGEKHEIRKA